MRLLIIAPMPSHPAIQGNSARLFLFCNELKERGVILDFIYYGMEPLTFEAEAAMRAWWHGFTFVESSPPSRQTYPSSWGIDDWCPDHLCCAVEEATRKNIYDAVIVNYAWLSKVLDHCDGPLKIIDTHDIFAGRRDKMLEAGLEPRWYFTSSSQEQKAFNRADIIIGIQTAESRIIRGCCERRVITVGHPVPFRSHVAPIDTTVSPRFGYFASGNPWNKRSALALDRALLNHPAQDWIVAGSICGCDLTFESQPVQIGYVEALDDFYGLVSCVLNPNVGGTGLKIKTIEALGYNRPIIGTSNAFEGINASHSFHSFSSVEDLAAGMADYSSSSSLRKEVLEASRSLAARYRAEVNNQFDEFHGLLQHVA